MPLLKRHVHIVKSKKKKNLLIKDKSVIRSNRKQTMIIITNLMVLKNKNQIYSCSSNEWHFKYARQ